MCDTNSTFSLQLPFKFRYNALITYLVTLIYFHKLINHDILYSEKSIIIIHELLIFVFKKEHLPISRIFKILFIRLYSIFNAL